MLLRNAAAPSLARIRRDREKAPAALRPLVSFIGENLFDPKLRVSYLRQRLAHVDDRMMGFFRSAVGKQAFYYIEDRRMETACRLLTETRLLVWRISELLGFKTVQVFSRAFKRWSGMRPTVYRQRHGTPAARKPSALRRLARQARLGVPQFLRRCLEGGLDPEHARAVLEHLRRLYPDTG